VNKIYYIELPPVDQNVAMVIKKEEGTKEN
jgi:hypothetical protein